MRRFCIIDGTRTGDAIIYVGSPVVPSDGEVSAQVIFTRDSYLLRGAVADGSHSYHTVIVYKRPPA